MYSAHLHTHQIYSPVDSINAYHISVLHQCYRPAHKCLGCHMTYHDPVRCSTEASISYQGNGLTQAGTNQCRAWTQHLRHARATRRRVVYHVGEVFNYQVYFEGINVRGFRGLSLYRENLC